MNLKLRQKDKPATEQKFRRAAEEMEIYPVLDYPRPSEIITSRHYTLRISVPTLADNVEVSINDGPWRLCRNSVGFWWFDWANYGRGQHKVLIRAKTNGGKNIISKSHDVKVEAR